MKNKDLYSFRITTASHRSTMIMICQSPSTNSDNTTNQPLNGIFWSCGPWQGWGQVQSLPMCFQHLKASWFWVDNYSVPSQAAVTKEQELPKWSKMHRSLLLSNHTIMNPVTAFWGIEVKDRKREEKKRAKGGRKSFEHFVPVSFQEKENTRHDSNEGCPPIAPLLLEKWPLGRYLRHVYPKAHRPSLCRDVNSRWWQHTHVVGKTRRTAEMAEWTLFRIWHTMSV